MMQTQHANQAWEVGPVTIRALSSFTHEHSTAIRRAVDALRTNWDVDTSDDYDGYLSILISRVSGRADNPSFLISGKLGAIELAQMHNDQLQPLGRFQTFEEVIPKLIGKLASR